MLICRQCPVQVKWVRLEVQVYRVNRLTCDNRHSKHLYLMFNLQLYVCEGFFFFFFTAWCKFLALTYMWHVV